MRFRYVAAVAALLTVLASPPQARADIYLADAVITAVRGREVTLGVGTDDGVQRGGIYSLTRDGKVVARLRVLEVRRNDSSATIFEADEGFVVTVGDAFRFVTVEPLPTTPAATPVPAPTPTAGQPLAPATPAAVQPVAARPTRAVRSTVTAPTTTLSSVDGATVAINAGSAQGVRSGTNLPILRGGTIIGLVRVEAAGTDSSTGTVIWRDEAATPIAVGDVVGVLPGAALGTGTITTAEGVPAAPMRYETGASNVVVPRANHAYEYLAALAAAGLITRYPAHLFHDNGTRFHNTDEDITFTRAQIADLVREAINSPRAERASMRERAALDMLTHEFGRELQQIGVSADQLAASTARRGFQIGFSGQTRASFVGGDTDDVIDPYYDRYGGRRSKSGIDSRLNLFGQAGNSLRFLATIDSSSDVHENDDSRRFKVRRALLSYDANKLLRGLSIDFGRDELWWGPGHFGTLILGDAAGPLHMIKTTFKRGSYQLEGLYAPLGNGPGGRPRSLYGHNLQVNIGKQSRIGFAETVLLPQDQFDPILFASAHLPLPLFMVERLRHENNSPEEGNVLGEVSFETSLARGVQAYGELLLDDVGVNANNLVRNRVGTLVGTHLFTPRDPAKLGLYAEYGTLAGRTYLEFNETGFGNKDYYYRGRPLGYPVAPLPNAPGATGLRLDAYWRAAPRLRLGIGADLADLGAEIGTGTAPLVGSRQQTLRFRAAYDLSRSLTLVARAQHVSTSRPNFIVGEPTVKQTQFQLEVAHAF